MSVIFFLILTSLIVAVAFLGAFVWSIRSGQYEDAYTPSIRMLFDEEVKKKGDSESNLTTNHNSRINNHLE